MPLKNDDFVLTNGHLFCNSRYDEIKALSMAVEPIEALIMSSSAAGGACSAAEGTAKCNINANFLLKLLLEMQR